MRTIFILAALLWSQFSHAQSVCTPYSSIIYGGGIFATGSATVSNDANNLIIDLSSDNANGWHMYSVNIYAGPGPIPQNTSGAPSHNLFPYSESINNGADVKQYVIPLADLSPAGSGNPLQVAIFARMGRTDANGYILQLENSWVYGPNQFPANITAWWFDYLPCSGNVIETGCTNPQGYYKNHSAYTKKTPQPWPLDENSLLCGKKWYDVMKVVPRSGDAWTILAQQWITSMLNVANGASTGDVIDLALSDSQTLLQSNCAGLPKGQIERQNALENKVLLESYNKGLTGPGVCPIE